MTRRSFSFPPETGDEPYVSVPWFWIPQDNLKLRAAREHVPYDLWQQQASCRPLRATWRIGYIEKLIEDLGARFDIREIAFDRWGAFHSWSKSWASAGWGPPLNFRSLSDYPSE
ncbi:hypothetical protein ACU19_03905 [Actinobaculum suis]|nr:hypothetical protein ACU19_03905 [Actinobaculum suis]